MEDPAKDEVPSDSNLSAVYLKKLYELTSGGSWVSGDLQWSLSVQSTFNYLSARVHLEIQKGKIVQFTPLLVTLGILSHRANTGAEDFSSALRQSSKLNERRFDTLWTEAINQSALPSSPDFSAASYQIVSIELGRVLVRSAEIQAKTATEREKFIGNRHIIAALLEVALVSGTDAARTLRQNGILARDLLEGFEFHLKNSEMVARQDHKDAWTPIIENLRKLHSTEISKPVVPRTDGYTYGPAGYTSEFRGLGGTDPVPDHLGVEGLAHRLAELITLRETKLPLAIGLFGNWGSGKSHFMNLMDRHMKALTDDERKRSEDQPGPWCREIVPIYFNAWHYLDTNLWASLVTEIFDRLFRHVAGDSDSIEAQKQKIRKLIAELQKANGVASGAEEALELAKAAKARAEIEEQKAEAAAQLAAHSRDRLEGWIDGVLDNLQNLLPDSSMKGEWSEAVRVLNLEEARKSCALLTAQVAEFRSLQGRARAIGRAVLAPDGRTRRLAWLAGAVLGAPLVAGLCVWGVTFWSVEIRRVGMVR